MMQQRYGLKVGLLLISKQCSCQEKKIYHQAQGTWS